MSRLSVTWAAVIFAFTGPMTKACDLQGYLFVVALAAIFFRVNISLYVYLQLDYCYGLGRVNGGKMA